MKKIKDRHLDTPSEANRDKHINFVALEENEVDPADTPATGALSDEQEKKKQKDRDKTRNEKKDL